MLLIHININPNLLAEGKIKLTFYFPNKYVFHCFLYVSYLYSLVTFLSWNSKKSRKDFLNQRSERISSILNIMM